MTGSPKWHTNIGRGKTILDPMCQNLGEKNGKRGVLGSGDVVCCFILVIC